MPGPDYPWATYLCGAAWRRRPPRATIRSVILHARTVASPEAIAELRHNRQLAWHYIVLANGAVLQLVPERGWTPHLRQAREPKYSDQRSIAICLDGHPSQPSWPDDQVTAVARILSVMWSVRGALPVRDAALVCLPPGRLPELTAWPWLDMHRRVVRLATPIDRIYAATELGAPLLDFQAAAAIPDLDAGAGPPDPPQLRVIDLS